MVGEQKSLNDLPHGERLKRLRERAGLSQYDLGELVGVSWRMIYYYEKETKYPPIKLFTKLCSALGVTADEFMGINPVPERDLRTMDGKLLKRFCRIKELSIDRKRTLIQIIDTFLDSEELAKIKRS